MLSRPEQYIYIIYSTHRVLNNIQHPDGTAPTPASKIHSPPLPIITTPLAHTIFINTIKELHPIIRWPIKKSCNKLGEIKTNWPIKELHPTKQGDHACNKLSEINGRQKYHLAGWVLSSRIGGWVSSSLLIHTIFTPSYYCYAVVFISPWKS